MLCLTGFLVLTNMGVQLCYCFCGDKMVRLSNVDRARALGMVQGGTSQENFARHFNVHKSTISKLMTRYRDTGDVKDRIRSGRPRITSANTDRRIVGLAARRRFVTANAIQAEVHNPGNQRVSDHTIRNRLRSAGFRSRRAKKVPAMTADHHRRRLRWCQRHSRWNRQDWQRVLFTDESRFCLHKNDGRVQVWRRRGERHAACCVKDSRAFHGGSLNGMGRNQFPWQDAV